eukprot:TRINITY_DN32712_c0_g1_i1.p2 TRINITY_DN32712_c0_g1~~TRINITY_DN32712_c0_g1_i1.p2  ORF type:complete len:159 (-),score=1.12 TRINITY_DN32712_c0_g1_i1:20-496(-)
MSSLRGDDSVSAVDIATGQCTMVLDIKKITDEYPERMLIDSNDGIVLWYDGGRVVTYNAHGQLLCEFEYGRRPSLVRVSADGIFAIQTDEDKMVVRFVSGDGRLLRRDQSCPFFMFGAWTDEHFVVTVRHLNTSGYVALLVLEESLVDCGVFSPRHFR